MKTMLILVLTVLLTTPSNADVGGDGGLLTWAIGKLTEAVISKLPDAPDVPDDGEGQGGEVVVGDYKYVGNPRFCKNFPNGNVSPGSRQGRHKLQIDRCINWAGTWMLETTVYGMQDDHQNITVECDQSVDWSLRGMGLTGIMTINLASGTMTGRPMTEQTADWVLVVPGVVKWVVGAM